jgi:hypothetical protein
VRFELTKDFRPWRFSRPLPSTTRPPRPGDQTSYRTSGYASPLTSFLSSSDFHWHRLATLSLFVALAELFLVLDQGDLQRAATGEALTAVELSLADQEVERLAKDGNPGSNLRAGKPDR